METRKEEATRRRSRAYSTTWIELSGWRSRFSLKACTIRNYLSRKDVYGRLKHANSVSHDLLSIILCPRYAEVLAVVKC